MMVATAYRWLQVARGPPFLPSLLALTGHYRASAVLGPRQCVGDRESLGVLLGHCAGVVGYLRVGNGDCHGCSCSLDGNRTARRGSLGDDGIVQGELVRAAVQDPRELPCRVEYGLAAEVFVPAAPGVQVDSEAQSFLAGLVGWDHAGGCLRVQP